MCVWFCVEPECSSSTFYGWNSAGVKFQSELQTHTLRIVGDVKQKVPSIKQDETSLQTVQTLLLFQRPLRWAVCTRRAEVWVRNATWRETVCVCVCVDQGILIQVGLINGIPPLIPATHAGVSVGVVPAFAQEAPSVRGQVRNDQRALNIFILFERL